MKHLGLADEAIRSAAQMEHRRRQRRDTTVPGKQIRRKWMMVGIGLTRIGSGVEGNRRSSIGFASVDDQVLAHSRIENARARRSHSGFAGARESAVRCLNDCTVTRIIGSRPAIANVAGLGSTVRSFDPSRPTIARTRRANRAAAPTGVARPRVGSSHLPFGFGWARIPIASAGIDPGEQPGRIAGVEGRRPEYPVHPHRHIFAVILEVIAKRRILQVLPITGERLLAPGRDANRRRLRPGRWPGIGRL